MNDEEYGIEFERFLREKIPDFFNRMEEGCRKNFVDNSTITYFHRFIAKFRTMIDFVERNNIRPKRIADLGSWYPYASYFFKLKNPEAIIDLYDIIGLEWGIEPYEWNGIRLINFDLCSCDFPDEKYDMIFLGDVLEHLPCNLFYLQKRIMSIMEPNGHLIVSYPCLGHNAQDYDKVYEQTGLVEEHLREFTPETVGQFFTELKVLESAQHDFPGYGPTTVVLYESN